MNGRKKSKCGTCTFVIWKIENKREYNFEKRSFEIKTKCWLIFLFVSVYFLYVDRVIQFRGWLLNFIKWFINVDVTKQPHLPKGIMQANPLITLIQNIHSIDTEVSISFHLCYVISTFFFVLLLLHTEVTYNAQVSFFIYLILFAKFYWKKNV